MTSRELKAEPYRLKVVKFNEDYAAGKIPMSHKKYLEKYKRMVARWNKMIRPAGLTEQMKDFGAVSKRSKTHYSTYIYVGKNFTAEYAEESCETTWWAVMIWDDDCDSVVHEYYSEQNYHYTKADCLSDLFHLDQNYESIKKDLSK